MSSLHPCRHLLAGCTFVVLLTGCGTVRPVPLQPAELAAQNTKDLAAARADQAALPAELTLEEAMARALKYNLELKTKRVEEAMALNLLAATEGDMLPKLLGQLGYTDRDNDRISQSRDATTAGSPLLPSRFISQERSHTVTELGLSWSVLDFGLGYYRSRQQADRVLIAMERRRKATHLVLQDVRTAFWRVAGAQKLQERLAATIHEADEALQLSRAAEADRARDPIANARYQRQLLENLRLLDAIQQELSSAQVELATLLNVPAGQAIRVVEPAGLAEATQVLATPVENLEETALAHNPDLIEQHYTARVAHLEARTALLRLFPNLNLSYSLNHDTDRYLVNNSWNQAGAQLSYNFLSVLSYPAIKAYSKAAVQLADDRRVLAQVALLAQVHLARLQVANAVQQLNRARDIQETDGRLAQAVAAREAAQADHKLERVSSASAALLSELRYYQARASLQTAHARLVATLGVDPAIPSVTETSLADLSAILRQNQ